MQALTKFMNWIVRLMGYAIGVLIVVAACAIAIFGFTSFGARIVTEKVAEIISNRDMNVSIREPSGLLTGGLRAAQITVSDTRGVFAEVKGLSVNWNPLALLGGTFHAKELGISSINVLRKPVRTLPSPPDSGEDGGFKLPVKIDIDRIAVMEINLSEQLAGRKFTLTADGDLQADQNGGHGIINVSRQAVPDAKLTADVAFAPDQNQLRLKAQLAEPKGGLLATLLSLPGDPAVNIAVDGDGPISNWKGKLQAALDGQQRASIEGQHVLTPEGLHQLNLKGGGDLASLLPPPFRPLFAGQTNIDLAATFDNKGKIDIQTGNLATGSVVIAASGTVDPAGNNSLNANILGTSGPVDFRWPLAESEARLMVTGVNLTLTGDAQAARLNANISLDTATLPQTTVSNVKLTAKSDAFNLAKRNGAVQIRLVAGDATFANPDINRAIQGPITLAAPLQIAADGVGFNGTTFESARVNGTVNGNYKLVSQALTGNTKLTIQPAALPAELAQRFDTPISIETQVAGTIPSKINLSDLVVKSGTFETAGNITLDGDSLTADLRGRLPEIRKLLDNANGEVAYTVNASGPLTALAIKANLKAAALRTVDRTLTNLDVNVTGTADPKAPQGTVDVEGAIDGQPIAINADVRSKDGTTTIPAITVDVGGNRLNGNVELTPAFLPSGALTFDFPDISLLAALAGQRAEGDLKGAFDITNDNGRISIKAKANGSGVRRDGLSLLKPDVDLTISDLKSFAASGIIKADEISSGPNKLTGLAVNFTQQQNRTNFDLKSIYDANPLAAAGAVETNSGSTRIELERFTAKPRNIPVELSAPTAVTIANGIAQLDGLTVRTGNGSVAVTGSAGETLDIDATVKDLPASLANSFVPKLDAGGTISGKVKVTGTPAAPIADFDLDWKDAATSHTKAAGLSSFQIAADGKFADNRLDFNTTASAANGMSLDAKGGFAIAGSDAQTLSIDARINNVPAGLANTFVPGLAAEGLISGTVKAAGKLPAATAEFDLAWKNAATSQTKAAGLAGFTIAADGTFADSKLNFNTTANGANGLSLKAKGNVSVAGANAQSLSVDADVANIPAGLANTFVPGLAAEGLISGTVKAAGKLPAPTAEFDLTWKNAATSQTRAAGLSGFAISADGTFADSKLNFNTTANGANGLSLKAKGNVSVAGENAQSLSVDANVANIPAGLANSFVPGLAAQGLISGSAKVSGKLPSPTAEFNLAWKNAATSQTKAANMAGLGITADGTFANNRLDFNVAGSGGGGVSLKAKGNFTTAGPDARSLKADADISNLPAGIANAFVPGLAAEGAISGTVNASGKLPAPNVDFKLNWKNAATSQTKGAGLSPLGITANGKLVDNNLTIDTDLSGDGGLSMKGGGSVAISGNRALNLQFRGNVPFALLGAQLAKQGLVADGAADIDLRITGTAGGPVLNGTINTSGAKVVDVRRNLALNNLNASISMNGQQATISRLSGTFASGGTISASGTVGIQPNGGYPVNIEVKLDKAVYVDGTLVVATVDGTLGLRGPLLSNPTLSGRLHVDKASITVPQKLPTSLREIDVKHIHAPAAVRAQLRDEDQGTPSEKSSTITLDLRVEAPSRLYVRGRGIDSELGGDVTIKGTAAAPIVSGGFTMRRGRLTILNRRLDFTDKSRITFAGDLTPALDMEASSTSGTTTLTVDVAGLATDPAITFSSSPALPQDEVLAQLIFGQSMSKLSPIQIAQLADAVSQLAGGRSTSLFEGLRNQLGVDDLDISTDAKGQTSVSVGRYLNERTYFELQQGGAAGAKAIINLDVGRGVKLRAGAGGDGSGEAGIVYEREY